MPYQFKHIGIIGKYNTTDISDILNAVLSLLESRNIKFVLDQATMPEEFKNKPHSLNISDWPDSVDLCIVIGGDGTFLYAARQIHLKNIPILGVNAGRLGFLADVSDHDIEHSLGAILSGRFLMEKREVVLVNVINRGKVRKSFTAINDAVIHKRTMARMVELDTYIRGEFLCHYRADGLIISTPTGSTAYSLSAGGPIIEPNMDVLIIAPICPHTLNYRPVIVGKNSKITILLGKDKQDIQITIDGQEELILSPEDSIEIENIKPLLVIHPEDYQFQERLRKKLNWGLPPAESVKC